MNLRRVALTSVAVLLVGLALYIVRFSPLLVVDRIDVTIDTKAPTSATKALEVQVRSRITVAKGTPLLAVDGERVSRAIRDIPQVRSAEVRRGWPRTLSVAITTREPIAYVAGSLAGVSAPFAVVDVDGVVISTSTAVPALIQLTTRPAQPGGRTALKVYSELPSDIRSRVLSVGTANPTSVDSVTFGIKGNASVLWGSQELGERKAEVLRALLPQDAKRYDVSAPDLPTTVLRK